MELRGVAVIKLFVVLLIAVQVSTAHVIDKRGAAGTAQLFAIGDEYKYNYELLVTTGTEVPISHAASYRLTGTLRVQGISANTAIVKLEDLGIALYNGQWSYFPVPTFDKITPDDLSPLSAPFQIVSENGKFKTAIMNDEEPEWASNMKRGLVTYLQMNMAKVMPQKLSFFKDQEVTTLGTCPTTYEVLPITATGMGSARVTKFRNHADCSDVPSRIRHESRTYYPCGDIKTRDIMNSTSYAIYDLSVQSTKITIQKLTVLSSILYWPFTQTGPFLYSWYNMTVSLDNVAPIASPIPPPENSIDLEDLTYVFEQSDYTDAEDDISDLKGVEPLFFHQASHENEPEVVEQIVEKCHQTTAALAKSMLTADVFNDYSEFHGKSPAALIPLISSLDYDSLTSCYNHYAGKAGNSEQESLELQLFLDGLASSGTPPAVLVIRDILVKSEKDVHTLARLITHFPISIRHPSEALAKELDPIFELAKNPNIDHRIITVIELAMATLISRSCKKNLCTSSGLLEKYITHFEQKVTGAASDEDKVIGVLGLGNIGLGKALEKPFEIAQGMHPQYHNTVRIQSIWSLRPLILEQKERVLNSLLPVFFNRSETSEVRTSVFSFLMGSRPDERVLHEIAYTMWSETCPQVINAVVSTLTLMSKTEYPCNPVGSYARTILKYIPIQIIDPSKTASYAVDFYDKNNGFGRMQFVSLQKSGTSVLPLSAYVAYNNYIGGYSNSFLGVYMRLQGLEKLVQSQLSGAAEGDFEKVIEILSKIDIAERHVEPLQLELVIIHSGKAVQYMAADETTLGSKLKSFVVAAQASGSKYAAGGAFSYQHPAINTGVRYQQPLEIGTPVSVFANFATLVGFNMNVTKTSSAGGPTRVEKDFVYHYNIFGTTGVTNHIPAVNARLSVTNLRTSRGRVPFHSSASSQDRSRHDALQFTLFVPAAHNPLIAMTHATCEVSVSGDLANGIADEQAIAKLKESCPTCTEKKTVTVGDSARRDRQLSLPKPKLLRGVTAEVKYIDCERDHSKAALLKRLQTFFSSTGKNTGKFSTSAAQIMLGIDHALDFLFISPFGETCGMKAVFAQDSSAATHTKKITGTISRRVSNSPPKVELFTTLQLSHEGEAPSETKVDVHAILIDNKQSSIKQQQINIKGAVINGRNGQSGVACLDIDNKLSTNWDDPLAYTGQSDPIMNQTITLKIGKFPSGQPSQQSSIQDLPCLTNHAEVTFKGNAHRSSQQILEAGLPNLPPYSQCTLDKASGFWPGKFIPPTKSCELAMLEQTSLRSANLSVCYKVAKGAKKRWAAVGHLASAILSPYLVDSSEVDSSDHVHATSHSHRSSTPAESALYTTGDVEINLNLQRNAPQMDVHYSKGSEEERHFHNVDLSLLPSLLVPQPFPARVSPLQQLKRLYGYSGTCAVSPSFVTTLDGWQYPITLSSECSVLISGDCSKSSQYAIIARQMPNQQLGVIIQVQDTRIELQNPTTAVIDGALKSFRNFEEFGKANKFLMHSRVDEIYVTFFNPTISVRYTGSFITVDLGSLFKGVNCGLCGNWDGGLYNDLAGPKVCPRPLTGAEMVQAWVVREGQCTDEGQSCPAT